MKPKISLFSFLLLLAISISSCELTKPIAATENPTGKKVGKSTAFSILYFPPFIGHGNSGIQKAAENGKITQISTVDYTVTSFIVFTIRTCTVTGN